MQSIFRTATTQDFNNLYGRTSQGGAKFFTCNIAEGVDWGHMRFAMQADREQDAVERMKKEGVDPFHCMSQDEWKQSEYYREGIEFDRSMPMYEAAALAEAHDQRIRRQAILDDYQGPGQTVMSLGGQLIGQLLDPLNFVSGAGIASKCSKLLRGFSMAEDITKASWRSAFAYEAAENAFLIAATQPFIVRSMQREGAVVDMDQVFTDILVGGVIGGTFGLGRKWLAGRKASFQEQHALENGVVRAIAAFDEGGSLRDLDVARPQSGLRVMDMANAARSEFSFRKMADDMGVTRPRDYIHKIFSKPFATIRETLSSAKRQFDEAWRRAQEMNGEHMSKAKKDLFQAFEKEYSKFMQNLHGMDASGAMRVLNRLKSKLKKMREAWESSVSVRSVWEQEGPEVKDRLESGPERPGAAPEPEARTVGPDEVIEAQAAPERAAIGPAREAGDVHAPVEKGEVEIEPEAEPRQPRQIVDPVDEDTKGLMGEALAMFEARIAEAEAQIRLKAEGKSSVRFATDACVAERKFIFGFLRQFSFYSNIEEGVANYVVWDRVAKELKIIRLDKEKLGKRFFAIAGPQHNMKWAYAQNLYQALKRGYFSPQDLIRMWDEHYRKYQTLYVHRGDPDMMSSGARHERRSVGDDVVGARQSEMVLRKGVNIKSPEHTRVTRNSIEEGDIVVLEWGGKYGTFEAVVVRRVDKGDVNRKGETHKTSGFMVRMPDGQEKFLKDGERVELVRDDIIYDENNVRMRNPDHVNLIEAVREAQRAKMKSLGLKENADGSMPKRSELTQAEYQDVVAKLARKRSKEGFPSRHVAAQRTVRSVDSMVHRLTAEKRLEFADMSTLEIEDWMTDELFPALEAARETIKELGNKKNLSSVDAKRLAQARQNYMRLDLFEEIADNILVERSRKFGDEKPVRGQAKRVDENGHPLYDPYGEVDGDPYSGAFIPPDNPSSPRPRSRDAESLARARAEAEANLSRSERDLDADVDERADAVYEAYMTDPDSIRDVDPDLAREVIELEERGKAIVEAVDTIWKECK